MSKLLDRGILPIESRPRFSLNEKGQEEYRSLPGMAINLRVTGLKILLANDLEPKSPRRRNPAMNCCGSELCRPYRALGLALPSSAVMKPCFAPTQRLLFFL